MEKKVKIPIYCSSCGSKLEHEQYIDNYNEQTGEPNFRVRVRCRKCQEEGYVVYFGQSWETYVEPIEKLDLSHGVCKKCGGDNLFVAGKGMTHYYYCNDCDCPVDLKLPYKK